MDAEFENLVSMIEEMTGSEMTPGEKKAVERIFTRDHESVLYVLGLVRRAYYNGRLSSFLDRGIQSAR